ncbi:MAG: sugar kinase, partial [Bacteroidales bacterium]|nr:sugar kinase [Bacteroidales bacterium]
AKFNPVVPEAAKDADFLMLGNLTPAIQIGVIKQMAKRPKLIVLDTMNFWMDSAWDDLMEVLTMIDVLTINDEEARQLSGKHSLVAAAKKILTMGPKYLVVKKGEHGALLFSKDEMFSAPAMPLESVFDPTGAGDTFAGGFIGYLAKQNDVTFEHLRTALIHGSALASFTVEKFGTQRLQDVTDAELKNRLMDFHNLVRFSL